MAKPIRCSLCEETATVHLSQVVHGKVTKVHLCESCAQKGGATDPAVFQLADALAAATPAPALTCPHCGFTDLDFRKRGRLGCPACWETFGEALGGLLLKVQHESAHVGRAPAGVIPLARLRRRLEDARAEMAKAVAAEDYEAAARLRDEVAALERQLALLTMSVEDILAAESELTHLLGAQQAIVLSTRIRLARNLAGLPFPGWAKVPQRKEIADRCVTALEALPKFRRGHVFRMAELGDRDRAVLVERHLVSKELAGGKLGAAVISRDQTCSVMVNEEDHLRLQVVKAGWHLRGTWHIAEQLDDALGAALPLAFSDRLGYLTACPTNVGTGLRASAMVHLPGLCLAGHMDKVTRALNQDGLAVRGWLGEGTEAAGNVFQISNQQTLGLSEDAILRHLGGWIKHVVEQEWNARRKLAEEEGEKFVDRLARSLGVLRSARLLTSSEAMNMLSHLRLACDLGCLPEERRHLVDRLMIEGQPAHVQARAGQELDSDGRDRRRAAVVREALKDFPEVAPPA